MNYNLAKNYTDDDKVEWKKMRDGSGHGMAELGEEKEDVVVIGADTAGSARAKYFAEKFPDRFVQTGIQEQNMVGLAAGFAYEGFVPYAVTYASFLVGRPWEPIRTTIAYPNNHAVFVSSHAGIATGPDGPTHQMTEDISIMRCLPNFTVICPADYEQAKKAAKAAYDIEGPVYIRTARENTPVFTTEDTPFEVGKGQVLREGKDVTLVGHGYMTQRLLQIAEDLEGEKVSAEVINMHTVEPIDGETLEKSAKKTGKVFVAEDHNVKGGLGGAVAEYLSEHNSVPVKTHGLHEFAESGSAEELWKKYKLDKEGTREVLDEFLKSVK